MKDRLANWVERFWIVWFWLLGWLRPRSPRELTFRPNQTVLVIAPHPDDEVIGCGGTILRHVANGDDVHIAYVTDGSASRAGGLSADAMRQTRYQEAHNAAKILGAKPHWLGINETEFNENVVQRTLARLLSELQPTIIYAPSCVDFHPIHTQTAQAIAAAFEDADPSRRVVRVYQIQVPLTAVLVNRICQLTRTLTETRLGDAVAAHASQQISLGSIWRQRRYARARYRCKGLVEEFWEMDTVRYVKLHRKLPLINVRSLRYRPWFDPLAYWIGRKQRKSLTQTARHPTVH